MKRPTTRGGGRQPGGPEIPVVAPGSGFEPTPAPERPGYPQAPGGTPPPPVETPEREFHFS